MEKFNYNNVKFLISAAKLNQLPPDAGIEIAFAGRSNAGKSSALNTLLGQKNLARVSKTPGRTRLINLFELNNNCRLVDLPGYGYAKVCAQIKQDWQYTLGQYLQYRQCLKCLILLMDCRHPLKDIDQMLIDWAIASHVPIHILLTKSDKLNNNAKLTTLNKIKQKFAKEPLIGVQLFSALKKDGVGELKEVMNDIVANKII